MEKLFTLVNPELALMGFELIELDFAGGSLRITIDKPSGVSLDDCVAASRRLGLILDASDPIEGRYRLEVSSPGLNRRLKSAREYEYFSGRKAKVQTAQGVMRGTIRGLKGEQLILEVDGEEVAVPLGDIMKANLDF